MALQMESTADHTTARLDGEVTIFTIEALRDELFGLLNYPEVRLDVSAVEELDGCGAQLLMILTLEAERAGRKIIVPAGNPVVDEVWELMGCAHRLQVNEENAHGHE